MERALRPRINAPDVVRSTLSHKELKYNESTIDQLLGTPNKIFIPERYVPEKVIIERNLHLAIYYIVWKSVSLMNLSFFFLIKTPELTREEQEQRLKKVESIKKMLSETTVTTPEGAG